MAAAIPCQPMIFFLPWSTNEEMFSKSSPTRQKNTIKVDHASHVLYSKPDALCLKAPSLTFFLVNSDLKVTKIGSICQKKLLIIYRRLGQQRKSTDYFYVCYFGSQSLSIGLHYLGNNLSLIFLIVIYFFISKFAVLVL